MDQYAGRPGHSTYWYAELAVSSLAVAKNIPSTHSAYPWKNGQASFINFIYYCAPSSGFYGAGKYNRGRCTDNPPESHPIRTTSASTSIISPIFTPRKGKMLYLMPICSTCSIGTQTHTHTCSAKYGMSIILYKPKTTNTHTHPFKSPLSRTSRVSRYQKDKPIWILLKQETVSGSGICWAICKSAPRSRQITTPAPYHSVLYRPDALPAAQPTVSKHWRQQTKDNKRQ